MYTLKQNSIFSDDIKLEKKDGTTEILSIRINISPEIVQKYRELQIRIIDLQKGLKNNPTDTKFVESIGKAVIDMFSLLFGEDNTKKLIDFYFNDYTSMVTDLFPYIQNEIVPKFNEIVKHRKETFKRRRWK